jgi:hypothetical protein
MASPPAFAICLRSATPLRLRVVHPSCARLPP